MYKNFLTELTKVSRNIYEIPGNHDYWGGKSFPLTFLISVLCKFSLIKKILYSKYVKRLGLNNSIKSFLEEGIFNEFEKSPVIVNNIGMTGAKILLVRIDSNHRNFSAMAQGTFPVEDFLSMARTYENNTQYSLKILLIHHHLVDYLHEKENNFDYIVHEVGTRVTNSHKANKLLEAFSFNFIMHGHKHQQDSKIFTGIKNHGVFLAAPAAFLDSPENCDGKIGFNFVQLIKNYIYTVEIRLKDGEYKCVKVDRFKR